MESDNWGFIDNYIAFDKSASECGKLSKLIPRGGLATRIWKLELETGVRFRESRKERGRRRNGSSKSRVVRFLRLFGKCTGVCIYLQEGWSVQWGKEGQVNGFFFHRVASYPNFPLRESAILCTCQVGS
jgi:hypothetical protein